MSECKHEIVWDAAYFCKVCDKGLLAIYEEQDTTIAALKEQLEYREKLYMGLVERIKELHDENSALTKESGVADE